MISCLTESKALAKSKYTISERIFSLSESAILSQKPTNCVPQDFLALNHVGADQYK